MTHVSAVGHQSPVPTPLDNYERRRAAAVELYRSGRPVAVVLAEAGISLPTLYRALRAAGVPRRLPRHQQTALDEALSAYIETSESLADISRRTGVGIDSLHYHRRHRELPRRARKREASPLTPGVIQALELYQTTDVAILEICELTGITSRQLAWARRREQVPARPRRRLDRSAVLAEINGGDTLAAISARHGITPSTVARWAKDAGITPIDSRRIAEPIRRAALADARTATTAIDVARRYEIGSATMLTWAGAAGICFPRSGQSLRKSPELRASVLDAVRAGDHAALIARMHGIDPSTVTKWASQEGIPIAKGRPVVQRAQARYPDAIDMMSSGSSGAETARALGIHPSTVYSLAASRGIVLPRTGRVKAIDPSDLDELRLIYAERAGSRPLAASTVAEITRRQRQFVTWAQDRGLMACPAIPDTVIAFITDMALYGCSGRSADRGELSGWSASSLRAAVDAISRLHREAGWPDPLDDWGVGEVLDRALRAAPTKSETRSAIRSPEILRLRSVTAPVPPLDVQLARVALFAAGELADDPARIVHQLVIAAEARSWQTEGDGLVVLSLPAYSHAGWQAHPHELAFRHHETPLPVLCSHCAVVALARDLGLDDLTRTGRSQRASHVRDVWSRAARRAGWPLGLYVPGDPDLGRLAIHLDYRLVTWIEQHAVQALLRATAMRVSEVISLTTDDVLHEDAGYIIHVRRRKNDPLGIGLDLGISAEASPGACAALELWLWVRGTHLGPLFPGRLGGHRSADAVRSRLGTMAAAAGLEIEHLGPHGFRRGYITDIGRTGVSIYRIAQRVGVGAQSAYDYVEADRPYERSIAEELGLCGRTR